VDGRAHEEGEARDLLTRPARGGGEDATNVETIIHETVRESYSFGGMGARFQLPVAGVASTLVSLSHLSMARLVKLGRFAAPARAPIARLAVPAFSVDERDKGKHRTLWKPQPRARSKQSRGEREGGWGGGARISRRHFFPWEFRVWSHFFFLLFKLNALQIALEAVLVVHGAFNRAVGERTRQRIQLLCRRVARLLAPVAYAPVKLVVVCLVHCLRKIVGALFFFLGRRLFERRS
jgi:hypothetical protein